MPKFKTMTETVVYFWQEVEADHIEDAWAKMLPFSQVFTAADGVDFEAQVRDFEVEENDDA